MLFDLRPRHLGVPEAMQSVQALARMVYAGFLRCCATPMIHRETPA